MLLTGRRRRAIDIWPGFVDALAALLMVVMFVLLLFSVGQFLLTDALVGRDQTLDRLRSRIAGLADVLAMERKEKSDLQNRLSTLSGELEVFLPDSAERFSKVVLARRAPGHYVGEYSFLDSSPASACVRTVGESVLFRIPHEEVENVFRMDHEIGQVIYRNLLINLVSRLRESHHELDVIQPFT